MTRRNLTTLLALTAALLAGAPAGAQRGAADGEWRFYGGDAASTKYSPLDQIDAGNFDDLQILHEFLQIFLP